MSSGPAFPPTWKDMPGMSLRDWFAGQALAGLLASIEHESFIGATDVLARSCYAQADAMLAERDKPLPSEAPPMGS